MATFFSPFAALDRWTFGIDAALTVPPKLRYEGYNLRGLTASHPDGGIVQAPANGIVKATEDKKTLEVQANPFPIRLLAAAFPWGLPTFYLFFQSASDLDPLMEENMVDGEERLGSTTSVTIACAVQDRFVLDPTMWIGMIQSAINSSGADASDWALFADAVAQQINALPGANVPLPVLILDHAGQPRREGRLKVTFAGVLTRDFDLEESDGGDLQETFRRTSLTDPTIPANLWTLGDSFNLEPLSNDEHEFQLAKLKSGEHSVSSIDVTQDDSHILYTNLKQWFAEQDTNPGTVNEDGFQRYTRNNLVQSFINGPDFFDNLFTELNRAALSGTGGFHLSGFVTRPGVEFTSLPGIPHTLIEAVQLIVMKGGECRFLSNRRYQLKDVDRLGAIENMVFGFIFLSALLLNTTGWRVFRSDGPGIVVMFLLVMLNSLIIQVILDDGGLILEPNKEAVDSLETADKKSISRFASYPALVKDNATRERPSPPISGFPFNTIFKVIRHFGSYHQKLSIIRNGSSFVGYCGGIDIDTNRLDTVEHLARDPFHDVHARIEGPAVRELALTFEDRWNFDSPGDTGLPPLALAFETPAKEALELPDSKKKSIVQVARTYFAPQPGLLPNALPFAPVGDSTIANTLLKAIRQAREFIYIEDQYFTPPEKYQKALLEKVFNSTTGRSEIRKLIIVIPSITDQLFGEIERSNFIRKLRESDKKAGGGIVHIGYPRRRFTIPDNEARASSGKLILGERLESTPFTNPMESTIVLGPKDRVPVPPFWVSVEGELIWVHDESVNPPPDPDPSSGIEFLRFEVNRGDQTRLFKDLSLDELKGSNPRIHEKGAAATVTYLSSIYVHSKMMVIDDVFLSIGSANLNKRSLCHDGEINIFTLPHDLKTSPDNPIAKLRQHLWAEMLDLPAGMSEGFLRDPIAASKLFDRSPYTGNRFVDIDAIPLHLMLGATTGDGVVTTAIELLYITLGSTINNILPEKLYEGVIDPTSAVEDKLA